MRLSTRASVIASGRGVAGSIIESIPNQMFRISSHEGSLTHDGFELTSVTDVSDAGTAITMPGSYPPNVTVGDSRFNGFTSYRGAGSFEKLYAAIDASLVRFVVLVGIIGVGAEWQWDVSSGTGFTIYSNGSTMTVTPGGSFSVSGLTGTVRVIFFGLDGVTPTTFDGVTQATLALNTSTPGVQATISGRASSISNCAHTAFLMACSSAPSASQRSDLLAELTEIYIP